MIIDIKATRQAPAEPDPSRRYVLKGAELKSRTPFALGLMLAGLVLYLRSFFESNARPAEEGEEDRKTEKEDEGSSTGAGVAQDLVLPVDHALSSPDDYPQESDLPADERFLKELARPESLQAGITFDIDVKGWVGAKSFGFGSLAANDNAFPGSLFHAPATGSNPGGGKSRPDIPGAGSAGPDDGETETDAPGEDGETERANRAPRVTGPVYLLDVTGCASLVIALSDLLRNAQDPDGDVLSIRNLTISHGTLVPANGYWLFQGGAKLEGQVTLSYQITDGDFFVDQVAYFNVRRNVIEGSDGNDIILGTACGDDIAGGAGDDNIDARGGDDVVAGGNGDDHIVAGDGDDIVFAGNGDDIVFGGAGNDTISGGDGDDRLYGDDGNDVLFGDAGNDMLFGGAGADILDGGEGDDRLYGDDGDDLLIDGPGRDVNFGGDGDDRVVAAPDGDDDIHDGGDGHDTIDYSRTASGVTIDLDEGRASGVEIGSDTLSSFEAAIGGSGNDYITASTRHATVLTGGAGDDVFRFLPPALPAEGAGPPVAANHIILDFAVGDRIHMSKYDIFERVLDRHEDQFEAIYGDDFEEDDIAIRYRHDRVDELSRTVIEADFNRDGIWETTVTIDGARMLVVIEQV